MTIRDPLTVIRGGTSLQRIEYEGRCNAPKPGNWRDACQRFPHSEGDHMARWSRHAVHSWSPESTPMRFSIREVPAAEWEGTGVPSRV